MGQPLPSVRVETAVRHSCPQLAHCHQSLRLDLAAREVGLMSWLREGCNAVHVDLLNHQLPTSAHSTWRRRPTLRATPGGSPSLRDADRVDQAILSLLVFEPGLGLWAIDELVREIGGRIDVDDSVRRLERAGLMHRVGEDFVFASRAAIRAAALLELESEPGGGGASRQ